MTRASAFYLILSILFGTPEAAFHTRVYSTITKLCPATSVERRALYAATITRVSIERDDPEATAEALLGIGAHETCFATEVQRGGPAVGAWQVESKGSGVREAILADPLLAARAALRVLDACHESLRCYAGAKHDARGNAVTAQLASCVEHARRGLDQRDTGPCRAWYKEPAKRTKRHTKAGGGHRGH